MSLSGLHPYVDILRLVIFRGGCMDLLSFGWVFEVVSIGLDGFLFLSFSMVLCYVEYIV